MLVLNILRKKAAIYYIILFPGVVLHELSHMIGCLIAGARIKKASLFNSQGGYVVHEKPAIPIVGDLIISIFPLVVGITAVFILTKYFIGDVYNLQPSLKLIGGIALATYLGISIIINMLPSWQDFTNASYGFVIFCSALVFLETRFTFFKDQLSSIAAMMGVALAVLIVVLIASFITNTLRIKFLKW